MGIAANTTPDHDRIATFRRRFLAQIEAPFVQLQVQVHEMKCLKLGKLSPGGSEIAAHASKHKALSWEHANKVEAQLREEVQRLSCFATFLSRAQHRSRHEPVEIDEGLAHFRGASWQ